MAVIEPIVDWEHVHDREQRLARPCDDCRQIMSAEDWADRHWAHADDCTLEELGSCVCDIELHPGCCETRGCPHDDI